MSCSLRSAQARRPVRLSSHSVSLSSSWPHLVLECFRGCAAGPRAGRPRAARCEAPTPSWRPDLTLPAVSPVPIAQGVPLIGALIAFSRLTDVAAITGFCRFRRFRKNQDALPHQHRAHGRGDRMRCCGSLIGILGTWRSLLLVIISRRLRDPPLSPNENPRSKPRPGRRGCAGTLGSFVTRKQPSRRDI